MPKWLASDFPAALVFAGSALLIGVAFQFIAGVALLVLAQVASGYGGIDWSGALRTPIDLFVSFHGPIEGIGIWAMSLLWIGMGFWIAARLVQPQRSLPGTASGARWAAFMVKTAVLYIIPVTVVSAILDPNPIVGVGSSLNSFGGYWSWNIAAAFFLGLVAALLALGWALPRVTGRPLLGLLGLGRGVSAPTWLSSTWAGARRVMLIALPSLLALWVLGTLLEALTEGVGGFRFWLALLLTILLSVVLWAGLDVGFLFMIMSMRFFIGDSGDFGYDMPAWMWIGVAIVAVAFLLGGMAAAERSHPKTAMASIGSAALVGPMVGVSLLVVSWFALGSGNGDVLAGPAIGLPILWSVAAAIGGFLHATKHGLASGIRVEVSDDF